MGNYIVGIVGIVGIGVLRAVCKQAVADVRKPVPERLPYVMMQGVLEMILLLLAALLARG